MAQVQGSNLNVGDVIATWAGKVRIVGLRPYSGPLADVWPEGAQIATFDKGPGMTIGNADAFELASFAKAEA